MKKIILTFIICSLSAAIYAQDIIVYANGNTITAKILEISDTQIKYKNYNNLNGPTYVIDKAGVLGINYANGANERFANETPTTPVQTTPSMIVQDTNVAANDNMLLKQYANYGNYAKKAKKWNTAGWTCLAVGLILGGAQAATGEHSNDKCLGAFIAGAGVISGSICFLKSYSYARQSKYLAESTPVFQTPINMGKGKNVMASFDVIKDNVTKKTLPGVGLSYNF